MLFRALKLDAGTATAAFDQALDRLVAAAPPSGIEGGAPTTGGGGRHSTTGRRCWPTTRT
jgi:hypothetical protein